MTGKRAGRQVSKAALAVWIAVASVSGAALAGGVCTEVRGTFVNNSVPPPECTSPVLLCTHGDLDGDLDGDYDFTMTALEPLVDPTRPTYAHFTGESIITLADGQMFANDHGEITVNPLGASPFTTFVSIENGNGAYAGAVGQLVAVGSLDLVSGAGSGEYKGEICLG